MTQRALLSVSDKSGIVELAQGLMELGIEIISTGGTAAMLQKAGLPVTAIELVTGVPEMLGGRVKTLHPKVHGGLLARRHVNEDEQELHQHGIVKIELLVVNLYPFAATIQREGVTLAEAIEQTALEEPFTRHDLRAKVGSDADSDARAQALLGHESTQMTRKHYRRRVPLITPAK